MSDKDSSNRQLAASQGNYELRINESFDECSPAALFAKDTATSTGLVWGYRGGRWSGIEVPNGTLTLTGSATNYVVANPLTAELSVSTSTTNWNSGSYLRVYKITTGTATVTDYEDHRAGIRGTNSAGNRELKWVPIALSDEVTGLTTGTKFTWRWPEAFTVTAVRACVASAPTGSAIQVDINKNGSSILSTKLTIDATEKTSTTAATPAVIGTASIADDDEITIDIDSVGSSTPGAGLKVTIYGYPA